jgi:hypothetical protein
MISRDIYPDLSRTIRRTVPQRSGSVPLPQAPQKIRFLHQAQIGNSQKKGIAMIRELLRESFAWGGFHGVSLPGFLLRLECRAVTKTVRRCQPLTV